MIIWQPDKEPEIGLKHAISIGLLFLLFASAVFWEIKKMLQEAGLVS